MELGNLRGTFDSTSMSEFLNMLISMGKISRLKKLNVSRNFLDAEGFLLIGGLLANGPPTITELYMQECYGSLSAIESFVEGFKMNRTLTILDLRENDIGFEGAIVLAESLQANNKLKQLHISSCNIESRGTEAICTVLLNNVSLEVLNLGDNDMGDEGAAKIGSLLESNRYLKQLSISENNISDEGMIAISKSLIKNRGLAFLGLQWNRLTNEAAEYLSQCISRNNTLKSIHVLGNAIDRAGIKSILEGSKMANIKPVDVDMAGMDCCVVSAPSTPKGASARRSRPSTATTRPVSASRRK